MAEWLRRLGDLTVEDLHDTMSELLDELETEKRAVRFEIPGRPGRVGFSTEEEANYRLAFSASFSSPDGLSAAETILGSLPGHSCVGVI